MKSGWRMELAESSILNPELFHHKKFLVAYSGGLDSHVMLQLLAKLREQDSDLQLRAAYINHHLSGNASVWQEHCQKTCELLAIDFVTKEISVPKITKQSLEANARTLRYEAFAEIIADDEWLITAHNQNDQAETILLQLLRGAGPKGLAAMPEKSTFHNTWHIRPLLHITREQIKTYAVSNHLQWIEDESNADINFDRNFLRHNVMPILQQRWPSVSATLTRSAKHCAEASNLLTLLAEIDLQQLSGTKKNTLSIAQLLALNSERQRNVLRYWLQYLGFSLPSEIKMQQIQHEILLAGEDKAPCVKWQHTEIRRYQDDLYALCPVKSVAKNWQAEWDMQAPLLLPDDLGTLIVTHEEGKGLTMPAGAIVTVRFRHEGERFLPQGRSGSHPLKKLFQEWHVPTWERNRIPLIFYKDELIAVCGYGYAEKFAAKENQKGIIFIKK